MDFPPSYHPRSARHHPAPSAEGPTTSLQIKFSNSKMVCDPPEFDRRNKLTAVGLDYQVGLSLAFFTSLVSFILIAKQTDKNKERAIVTTAASNWHLRLRFYETFKLK
jgi:hypothetical protein